MDSDDEIEESPKWEGIPGSLILINALEASSVITMAHEATCRLMKQYLKSSSSQMVGVSIYGTKESKSTFNTNNVVDILPMDVLTLEGYKKLRSADIESFEKASDLKLSEVLWHCSKVFKYCSKKLSSQTVFILSQLHNAPVDSDKQQTLKRVIDLTEFYTDIKFVNISQSDYPIAPFYNKFLIEANKSKEYTLPKPVWDIEIIQNYLYQHSHRHVALAKLCFEIGNGFSIGVGIYSLLQKPNHYPHKTSKVVRATNEIVDSVTTTTKMSVDAGNSNNKDGANENVLKEVPLLNSEMLYCQEYGGQRIEFTKEEKKYIYSQFGSPRIKLLGFKPSRILCKEKWFLKTGYFLYPNEKVIEGSTVAFKAFHRACSETNTVAICILCTRQNARPTIVALAPCSKPLDLEVEMGFDIIHIPFIEHVRDIPHFEDISEQVTVDESHKIVMKDIVQNLIFDYKIDMFENPKLQSQYRAIEAKALQETHVDPFVDTTIRNPECFNDIQADLFEELFGPFGLLSVKRVAEKGPKTANKKVKLDFDQDELEKRVHSKTVNTFTVAQLKNILKSKNVSISQNLRKKDLEELVYQNFS